MKVYIFVLVLLFSVSCTADKAPADSAANERIREKNKEVAAKNAVIEITRLAQKLEQNGRDMQPFREATGAESDRQCNEIFEERRKGLLDLETRVGNLPENYKNNWTAIIGELNECISCEKKNLDDCKRARASINEAIKKNF